MSDPYVTKVDKWSATTRWWLEANDLLGSVDTGVHLLDYGCGPGRLCRMAHEQYGFVPVGVDKNPEFVALAKKRYPSLEFSTVIPDKKFDVVVLNHVLGHVDMPLGTLVFLRNYMAPGAVIAIAAPNQANSRWAWPENVIMGYKQDESLKHYFTPRSLRRLLTEAGFEVLSTRVYGWKPTWCRWIPGVPKSRMALVARKV